MNKFSKLASVLSISLISLSSLISCDESDFYKKNNISYQEITDDYVANSKNLIVVLHSPKCSHCMESEKNFEKHYGKDNDSREYPVKALKLENLTKNETDTVSFYTTIKNTYLSNMENYKYQIDTYNTLNENNYENYLKPYNFWTPTIVLYHKGTPKSVRFGVFVNDVTLTIDSMIDEVNNSSSSTK